MFRVLTKRVRISTGFVRRPACACVCVLAGRGGRKWQETAKPTDDVGVQGLGEGVLMAARVMRRMSLTKASILVFVLVALLTTLFMIKMSQGEALPGSPTDSTAVPHYFGPWPNWALSPLTMPAAHGHHHRRRHRRDGDGHGRRQRRRHRHHRHQPRQRLHDGDGEHHRRRHRRRGDRGHHQQRRRHRGHRRRRSGSGYKKPTVTISGGGATTAATATAYGGVDAITLQNAGTGYQFPTVDFDMPDDPNGTQATGHADQGRQRRRSPAIVIDNPGSGYAAAPNIVIRDGTLMDPIANAGAGASATCTINVTSVALDTVRRRLHVRPDRDHHRRHRHRQRRDRHGDRRHRRHHRDQRHRPRHRLRHRHRHPQVRRPAAGAVQPRRRRQLPRLAAAPAPSTSPSACPSEKNYNDPNGNPIKADEYEIGLVQYRTKFSTDLPATLVRGYVQIETPANAGDQPALPADQRAAQRHQGRRPDQRRSRPTASPRRSGSARHSRRPRTSRSASSSATSCPPAPTAISSCRSTAR